MFDYDGVIELRDKPLARVAAQFIEILNVTTDEWKEMYHKHNHLSNVENMPWFDMVSIVGRNLGASDEQIEKMRLVLAENEKTKRLNSELLLYIKDVLKSKGYLTAVLSNNSSDLRERMIKHEIDHIFDAIVISAEEGSQKPHEPIFESLFRKLNVRADEVIFTDDNKKPLEKADIIGYTPILFKDFEQFKLELENLIG
ncbi:MAG: HAD-IA family hydrolase [Patescibacteria group bacterium]